MAQRVPVPVGLEFFKSILQEASGNGNNQVPSGTATGLGSGSMEAQNYASVEDMDLNQPKADWSSDSEDETNGRKKIKTDLFDDDELDREQNDAFKFCYEKMDRASRGLSSEDYKFMPEELREECDLWYRAFPNPPRSLPMNGCIAATKIENAVGTSSQVRMNIKPVTFACFSSEDEDPYSTLKRRK